MLLIKQQIKKNIAEKKINSMLILVKHVHFTETCTNVTIILMTFILKIMCNFNMLVLDRHEIKKLSTSFQ